MAGQIPKEVYAYVVSYLNTAGQTIPTVPVFTAAANNLGNYLIKIKDDSSSSVIAALPLGTVGGATAPANMLPTKIVCASDAKNQYVYVGGSAAPNGGIYRVVNFISGNTAQYIAQTDTNGIFDVDETNKKLYYSNAGGTSVIIKDMSTGALPNVTISTVYASITEIKVSPDGQKLMVAGTAIVEAVSSSVVDIYTKDLLGAWQLANRIAYTPNANPATNVITEIVINKASTLAYGVSPVGKLVSSFQLTGSFASSNKSLPGYTPNSVQLKGTELYIADNSGAKILKLNAVDLSVLLIIVPPYSPDVIPNKLALTAFEDALYVSPAAVNEGTNWRIDVIDPVTGIDTRKATYNVGLYNLSPIATFTVFSDNDISPTVPVPDDRLQDLNEAVCIITKKVFSSCKDKDCLADITTSTLAGTAPYVFTGISFGNAVISNTNIIFINDGKNLSRVQFDLNAPYTINYTANGVLESVSGNLNLGHEDILMYIPQTSNMNEIEYKLIAETYTEVLDGPKLMNNAFVFTVGVYEIFKIVQDVQLYVPAFGYCPVPVDCAPYVPPKDLNVCDTFMSDSSFPEDFFPFQYEHFKH